VNAPDWPGRRDGPETPLGAGCGPTRSRIRPFTCGVVFKVASMSSTNGHREHEICSRCFFVFAS
jgi:hypothetical protein